MIKDSNVLVDSDFWLGLYLPEDTNAQKARELYPILKSNRVILTVSNLIVGEVATIISHRIGQNAAIEYLSTIHSGSLDLVHISEEMDKEAIKQFKTQKKKGTSYVDCTNVAVVKAYKFNYICAFDKVYHQKFGIENLVYLNF